MLDFADVFIKAFENYKKIALYAGLMIFVFMVILILIIVSVGISFLGLGHYLRINERAVPQYGKS
jgi:hypothetical protein